MEKTPIRSRPNISIDPRAVRYFFPPRVSFRDFVKYRKDKIAIRVSHLMEHAAHVVAVVRAHSIKGWVLVVKLTGSYAWVGRSDRSSVYIVGHLGSRDRWTRSVGHLLLAVVDLCHASDTTAAKLGV